MFRRFFPFQTVHVSALPGRWVRCSNPSLTFKKVDWANEDHCGTCSAITQTPKRFFMTDNDILELMGCFTEVPSEPPR